MRGSPPRPPNIAMPIRLNAARGDVFAALYRNADAVFRDKADGLRSLQQSCVVAEQSLAGNCSG